MRIFRVLVGIFLILSIVGVDKLYQKQRFKKQEEIKGVQSARLDLSAIELAPIPIPKNGLPAPDRFWQGALIDTASGSLLFGKEEHRPVAVASLTKLATALVVVDNYQPDETVTISKNAQLAIGSKIFMNEGEQFKVKDLLEALLIMSANDAAIALTEHQYSQEDFAVLMNQKARDIGLKNTLFKDPSGLDDEGLSSAYDIGILLAECLKNPVLEQIFRTPEKIIYNQAGKEYRLESSNRLVKEEMFFNGIIGGKTGFTPSAGHNLATAASRNGQTLIAIIINTHINTKEASAVVARDLLNWGFENWEWVNLAN